MPREKDFGPGELGPPWTVLKLLRWTSKFFEERDVTETPRLDADLLLSHVLDVDRMDLYLKTDDEVPDAARDRFRALVKRRARGEPVAYLVGHREFWETDLKCDRRALVPRPDTEVLVETVIDTLEADGDYRMADADRVRRILDIRSEGGILCPPETDGCPGTPVSEVPLETAYPPLGIQSDVFRVTARARYGSVERTAEAVIDRSDVEEPRILEWRVR